jgi:hypothetical protein
MATDELDDDKDMTVVAEFSAAFGPLGGGRQVVSYALHTNRI